MTLINGEDVVGISVVVDTPFNLFPKLYIPNTLKVSYVVGMSIEKM